MKKAAIYARVSTPDQHLETQLHDLREMAKQRGLRSSANTPTEISRDKVSVGPDSIGF